MLKEEKPDVVILDVRLGPVSGMDLLADFYGYLESKRIQTKPRFIIITAYPDEDVKKIALEKYHVDAFLIKPFSPTEMKQKVISAIISILEAEQKNLSFHIKVNHKEQKEKKELVDRKIQNGLDELAKGSNNAET